MARRKGKRTKRKSSTLSRSAKMAMFLLVIALIGAAYAWTEGRSWRPDEVEMFALVARYHRKSEPSMKHAEYVALPDRERDVLRKLAAILRVADGLDRAHLATVQDMEVTYDSNSVRILLYAYRDCGTEVWGAGRKADLFERVFSRQLLLQPADGSRP